MTSHRPDPDGTADTDPIAEPLRPTWVAPDGATQPPAARATTTYTAPLAPVASGGPSKARVGLVVGAAAALGLGAVATSLAATPPVTPTSPAVTTAATPVSPGAAAIVLDPAADEGAGPFDHGRFGGPGGGRDITISAISGSNITLATEDGWTRTIAITGDVALTKGGQTIAVSDLEVGDQVRFSQTRNDDGTYTVTAVAVVVPSVAGTVSELSDTSFKVTTRDGSVWTITTDGSTTYRFGLAEGTRADVADGERVYVEGASTGDNALTALSVTVAADRTAGTVTAKSGSTITLRQRDGGTVTVNVDADTVYRVAGVESADLGDISVDMVVSIQGRTNSDGSIDASAVASGRGLGKGDGMGGFGGGMGRHGGMGPGADDGPAAPSASPSNGS